MSPDPPPPSRRPLWPLVALPVLMVLPPAVAFAVLAGLALARLAVRAAPAGRAALASRRAGTGRGLRAGRAPSAADPIPVGTDRRGRRFALHDQQLAAHGLILGASGSGKTTTLLALLTDQIRRGSPVVAVDLKGSPAFAETLAAAARASGRRLRIWSADGPEHWNPLGHGNATELKDKLVSTERFTEPHYQRAAERYVQLALGVLAERHPGRPPSLGEIVGALDPRRLGALASALPPARAVALREYLGSLTPDQTSAVRGLASRLAIMAESHVGPRLEPTGGRDIDLRRALTGDEVVLFSLNSSVYGKLAAQLGTLVVQDLTAAAGARLRDGRPSAGRVMVGVDEFSALGGDNVLALLARGREAGVSVLLATQELADLDRAGRGLTDQVLGNTAAKIVHRQDVPASALLAARMAGTERVWESSYQFGASGRGPFAPRRGTQRLVDRYRISPEEIMGLRTGEAMFLTKVPGRDARIIRTDPPGRHHGGR